MARTAILWPGGTRPLTVTPSRGSTVPDSSWRRAMTTSSAGWMRMTGASRAIVRPSTIDQGRVPGVHTLVLLAQAFDPQPHLVAALQVQRRLHAQPHPGRRAGADQVAGVERHEAADVAHERGHAEHHRLRAAVLEAAAVHVEPHRQRLRICDLVARDEPRPDRAEGVAALALVPLPAPLELVLAFRDVVDDAVARDMRQRIGLGDVARLAADHDTELHLPVGLHRVLRQHDRVVAADE